LKRVSRKLIGPGGFFWSRWELVQIRCEVKEKKQRASDVDRESAESYLLRRKGIHARRKERLPWKRKGSGSRLKGTKDHHSAQRDTAR